ncbi:hypothetical protein QN366_15385 [Pseudomonas sp. CCC3.2]|uniref:hypothetical protein n=1 Tax=unclassified Pseudomonas TaxID=196821 RepID=UPI002B2363BD|nr:MULTISPECIES: hypothetical protein [unclassified Pseudomonas]MEA9979771.1 hypothetical protein [Pseudomonas sp. RTS4]MEB0181436.1 hypothetical protein [Pseudomonas sp. CCC3.2]
MGDDKTAQDKEKLDEQVCVTEKLKLGDAAHKVQMVNNNGEGTHAPETIKCMKSFVLGHKGVPSFNEFSV